MNIKKSTILIAIDPCVMKDSGEATLTVGKEYEVMDRPRHYVNIIDSMYFYIIDDHGDQHNFYVKEAEEFFKLKES